MKKATKRSGAPQDEMRHEYDFTGGVRGKHCRAYRAGHSVRIHKEDGTNVVQHFTLDEGAVILDPDVRRFFADSGAVNRALRSLIALVPKKPRRKIAAK